MKTKGKQQKQQLLPPNFSRPRLERMIGIEQLLMAKKYPNVPSLALHFGMSKKAIREDIGFMIKRLNHPIDFDYRRNGFFYTGKHTPIIKPQASQSEIEALHFLKAAAEMFKGTPFYDAVKTALDKVLATFAENTSAYPKGWKNLISFHTTHESLCDAKIFDAVFQAAAYRDRARMEYRKVGVGMPTEDRLVDIYHIAKIDGEYFVFAFDVEKNEMRTFAPIRILGIKKEGGKFKRSRDFDINERLKKSLHVHAGDEDHDVRIRFSPKTADYMREKKFRCQTGLLELEGGGVELQLNVSSLHEVCRFVQNWGGEAVVQNPPELGRMVLKAGRQLVAEHERWDVAKMTNAIVEAEQATPPRSGDRQ